MTDLETLAREMLDDMDRRRAERRGGPLHPMVPIARFDHLPRPTNGSQRESLKVAQKRGTLDVHVADAWLTSLGLDVYRLVPELAVLDRLLDERDAARKVAT